MGRFVSRVVVNIEGVPLANAVGKIYAIEDVSNTTPLPIFDAGGSSFALDELKSNGDGVTPEFNTPSQARVKWVSGAYTMDMLAWDTIPTGGGTGQILVKNSDADLDVEWQTKFVVIGPAEAWPTGLPDGTIVVRAEA